MKLKSVEIENFRSIESIEIDFKENPRVLVGINESGKTNILHALRLLSNKFQPQKEDVREPTKGIIENSEVSFIFEFEDTEIEEIYQKIQKETLIGATSKKIIKINGKEYNLKEFCEHHCNEGLYEIDVKNNTKTYRYWSLQENFELITKFKKPRSRVNFTFQNEKGENLNLLNFKLIDPDLCIKFNIPQENVEDATEENFKELMGSKITEMVQQKLPKVIYWEYKEENLLPPFISINTFIQNLDLCIPLKNMFILANISEDQIGRQITETRNKSPNVFRSLLQRVSRASTKYFQEAWKEYKTIKFSLSPGGENIDCGVEEKNIWDFKRRSDGFKRFVTILLLLSIPAKKELLKNSLILIDEADNSLHPSGCRYLMEQLKKLAGNNYVMYSSHSIFMIDRENIERHYIVEKKNEITTIKLATEENYKDEEVLYKALGASVYEILEKENILFEGWDDKKLFEIGLQKIKDKNLKKFFEKIAKSHAIGTKSIKNIAPIIEFSGRKLFIVSDGDQISKQEQKEFKDNKGYGVWKKYDEIFKKRNIATSEDFIKPDILKNKFLQILNENNIELKDNNFELSSTNRLESIKQQLKNLSNDQTKEIIKKLKELIFRDLKPNEIEDDYVDFVDNLKQEIEKL